MDFLGHRSPELICTVQAHTLCRYTIFSQLYSVAIVLCEVCVQKLIIISSSQPAATPNVVVGGTVSVRVVRQY